MVVIGVTPTFNDDDGDGDSTRRLLSNKIDFFSPVSDAKCLVELYELAEIVEEMAVAAFMPANDDVVADRTVYRLTIDFSSNTEVMRDHLNE